jgi:transcriptional regulator with XRE-family HTH domain
MDFGKAIRICRSAYGLTQGQLARRLKLSASQVSLIESGRRQPSAEVLKNVSRALKVPLPLLMLLGSEAADLDDVHSEEEITQLAKSLLRLLVRAAADPPTARR